jgi:tRNA pseudouridine32 synthase/23S rRNA pseudouridine746 synthase
VTQADHPNNEPADGVQPLLRPVAISDRWIVVDKPAGVRTVPGLGPDGHICVVNALRAHVPEARNALTVHRLDMATSGLLVLALDPDTHRALSWQFESRSVSKRYTALLVGRLDRPAGEVTLPIRADITRRPAQIVDFVHGRAARTLWRVITVESTFSRVEFVPVTGRSHQLRLHAAAPATPAPGGLGAAIVGDTLYGGPTAPRLMLHASRLEFADPATGVRRVFESPPSF